MSNDKPWTLSVPSCFLKLVYGCLFSQQLSSVSSFPHNRFLFQLSSMPRPSLLPKTPSTRSREHALISSSVTFLHENDIGRFFVVNWYTWSLFSSRPNHILWNCVFWILYFLYCFPINRCLVENHLFFY